MAEYKNNIRLGVTLDSVKDIQTKLNEVIKNLNNTKINLDINLSNSDVAKQLDNLTNLANNFKKSLGGNITLGNINEIINQATSAMTNLNGELLKTNVKTVDNLVTVTKNVATNIGEVTKQTKQFINEGNQLQKIGQTITLVTENTEKLKKAMDDIQKSITSLDSMKLNGFIDTTTIDKLKADLNTIYEESNKKDGIKFSDNELKSYLQQVKQLEIEENKLIQIEKEENDLVNAMANGREKSQLKSQQTDRTNELNQAKAINKALEDEYRLQQQIKNSETNALTKDINNTISQVEKLQQKFGSKLPNGFIESATNDLNKMITELKEADNINFNGMRNNLNSVKSSIEQVTNETKQLASTSNNGGFFSGLNSFLGKIGIFYGVQQIVQEITTQLKDAVNYTIEMDKSMTNMQMITGKSKDEVTDIVNNYKHLGEQLHTTNAEMMKGMEEVTRAGYDGKEGEAMMSASIIGSKISGQTTAQVTEQLIAIKNAFNMTGESMQNVVDMISKMDNVSATSFKEIADAIKRTAFSAQEAGTPLSNLISYITTVSEKTRKAPETIGESFKTIYARYSNIKLGRMDEDGKTINDVETAMNKVGIAIRTNKGQFKEFDTVLNEFMQKYKAGEMDQVHYLAGVQALAGTRQRETLMALIENMETLNKHQKEVGESAGSAKKMMDEAYNPSLDARIQDLKRAFEQLYEKMTNSEQLKWLVTEFTQLINILSNVDGTTIKFIATIGLATFAISKLVAINKTLMAVQAGEVVATGFTQLLGVLTGMTPLMTTTIKGITETSTALEVMQVAQTGLTTAEVAGTAGATGLAGAFQLLKGGIISATESAIAFMMTPLGMVIGAIAIAIGVAAKAFYDYKQRQAEVEEQSKSLKTALEGVNQALKGGDTTGAQEQLNKAKEAQAKLEELIKKKKELENMSSGFGEMGDMQESLNLQELTRVNQAIKDQKEILEKAGATYDETTGKVKEFDEAQSQIDNANVANKIKEQTKAQLENRENLEQAQEEYNKFISTTQDLYSQYQSLSEQESLSAEQKEQLAGVCQQLQGKFTDLNVSVDENGIAHINNTPLIQDNISYLNEEGMTVDTLTMIRESDAKACSEWSINNQNMTYAEIVTNIENYKAEINALEQLKQARDSGGEKLEGIGASGGDALLNVMKAGEENLEGYKNKIDSIYGSIKAPVKSYGGVSSSSGGDYMPSGGSGKAKKGKSGSQKKDYTEDIANMKSDLNIDEFAQYQHAIKVTEGELKENKTLQDSLTKGSIEYQMAQQKEIDLYKQKQKQLVTLNMAQEESAKADKEKLENLGFLFDANNLLINGEQKLKEMEEQVDAEGGSTEEDKKKKQEDIKNLKDIQKEVQKYQKLTEETIPQIANEYDELSNSIKKVVDEMRQVSEETLKKFRDELAGDILEDLKKKEKEAEDDLENKQKQAKKALEDEKKAKADELEQRIKELQDELKALDDETVDNQEKLKKLKEERALWLKETGNVFAKSKVADLDAKIKETEKAIKKDDLQKQIDDLQKQKEDSDNNYDKKLADLDDFYEKQKEAQKKANDDELMEQKAYAQADELLKKNQQNDIIAMLTKYGKNYKDVGTLLGKNFTQGYIDEINKAKQAMDFLTGKSTTPSNPNNSTNSSTSNSTNSNSFTSTNSGSSGNVDIGDHVWLDNAEENELYSDASHENSKGTGWDNGVASGNELKVADYDNGFMRLEDSNGNDLGWVERDKLNKWNDTASYWTGGRTPSDIPNSGATAILHKNEKILNEKDTTMLDDIYNWITSTGSALMSSIGLSFNNPNSYSLAGIGTSLNDLANGAINNNSTTDNSITQPINMNVQIVNEKGSEPYTDTKLEKAMTKILNKQKTRFGGKPY